LSHKQGGLIHQFGVWLGRDLKIRLLLLSQSLQIKVFSNISSQSTSLTHMCVDLAGLRYIAEKKMGYHEIWTLILIIVEGTYFI
jgi:hypothetical protein